MIYLLIGYMWLFIHRPFEEWVWLAELRVERVYMLLTIAVWATRPKVWSANPLNKAIVGLASAILLGALFSPYEGLNSVAVQDWFKLLVFYGLVMTSVSRPQDLTKLIIGIVVIMGLYELHSLREYLNGRGVFRMGTWRMVGVGISDPNSFAASILYGLPMLIPVRALASRPWQKLAIWGLLLLGVGCIFLTGSRSAFAALILVGLGFAVASRYRWRILAVLAVAAPLVWANLSPDLRDRYMTLVDPSRGPANAQESAESRKEFFNLAIEIWRENPILGVGPGGFAHASGTGMQSHSLYAQTISELGTVGAIAVLFLVYSYFRNFFEARRFYAARTANELPAFHYLVISATAFTVLELMFLGFAGHNLMRFTWVWYAAFSALALRFLREESRARAVDAKIATNESHISAGAYCWPYPGN